MRAAPGALGTWALYSQEPLESVGLLLVYNPILGILLPISLGKGKHMLKEVQARLARVAFVPSLLRWINHPH